MPATTDFCTNCKRFIVGGNGHKRGCNGDEDDQ